MEQVTKDYFENPTLVIALSIGIGILAWAIWWLIKWVLNKLTVSVENNTSALNSVSHSVDQFRMTMEATNKIMNELTVEQKFLNQQLQKTFEK